MSFKNLVMRVFAVVALGSASLFAPVAQAQTSGEPYAVIDPVQPSDTPGKTEVLEFFAYSCVHCATMEPMLEKWTKTLPDNVVFKPVPVAFNASMADLQKLYYTLESLGRLDLHAAVFKALHDERKPIYDAKAITNWAVDKGIDRAQFEAAFNSFGINTKVSRANELAQTYKIQGTPTLAVGGKYVTSPSMTGTYESAITEAQKLLEQVTGK
ncbi:MAG TPA: thiol:disulfide interchange protein DsbA/DsbL [Eoetvoesiella sp.]